MVSWETLSPFAVEDRREHQLAFPAVAVFGEHRADRLDLPAIAAEPVEGGCDVFEHASDAEVIRATCGRAAASRPTNRARA